MNWLIFIHAMCKLLYEKVGSFPFLIPGFNVTHNCVVMFLVVTLRSKVEMAAIFTRQSCHISVGIH